ncbi:hypothetical protein PMAYCL1PPCAC_19276, partial [Pristionchus mayeri]
KFVNWEHLRMVTPISFRELFKLNNLGIDQSMIAPGKVSIQSGRVIDCRKMIDGTEQMISVNIDPPRKQIGPMEVNSAIVHPSQPITAYKDGYKLVLKYTMTKKMLKKHDLEERKIVFWKWISEDTLALVTEAHVYHWELAGDSAPLQFFKRHWSLFGCRILDYRVTNCLAVLIAEPEEEGRKIGKMQLYDFSTKLSLPIEGEAACFANFKMEGNHLPSSLFVSSAKNDQGAKLTVEEIGLAPMGNKEFSKTSIDVPITPGCPDDYPIFVQASDSQGIVYVVTKHGCTHIVDLESGSIIYSCRFSADEVLNAAEDSKEGGVIGVNCTGHVFSYSLDEKAMLEFLFDKNPELSIKLARRWKKSETACEEETVESKCADTASLIDDANEVEREEGEILNDLDHDANNENIFEPPTEDAPPIPSIYPQLDTLSLYEHTEPLLPLSHLASSPTHSRPLPAIPQTHFHSEELEDKVSHTVEPEDEVENKDLTTDSIDVLREDESEQEEEKEEREEEEEGEEEELTVLLAELEDQAQSNLPENEMTLHTDSNELEEKVEQTLPEVSVITYLSISLSTTSNRLSKIEENGTDTIHSDSNDELETEAKEEGKMASMQTEDQSHVENEIPLFTRSKGSLEEEETERDEIDACYEEFPFVPQDDSNSEESNELNESLDDEFSEAEKERDEIAARYKELQKKYRRALIIIGRRVVEKKKRNGEPTMNTSDSWT